MSTLAVVVPVTVVVCTIGHTALWWLAGVLFLKKKNGSLTRPARETNEQFSQ